MSLKSFPAVYMRGGTSRVLIFKESDLPSDRGEWDRIFLACLGSPDPYGRQLDGLGGGVSSLSKVCVLSPSEREDADVDYTFAQVAVTESKVDYKGNCGNVSSAVGPFAVLNGWCNVEGSQACVRIYNTNTQKIIHSYFPIEKGEPVFQGDLAIPGVSGQGAPIRLQFQNPGGAVTGKLLPTGQVSEILDIPGIGQLRASLVDAANPCVFIKAQDVGLTGTELPDDFENDPTLLQKLDLIRRCASVQMGIATNLIEAKNSVAIPYLGIVSPSLEFQPLGERRLLPQDMNFSMRVIASGQPHKALPLTVSLCAAVAAKIPGTVVQEVSTLSSQEIRIGMPSGVLTLNAEVREKDGEWIAESGSFYRTARLLFAGRVYC